MTKTEEEDSPIFILGSGRSGTTLLQKMLNSLEDVFIWGEHGWFLKYFSNAYFVNLNNKFLTNNLRLEKNNLEGALKIMKNPNLFSPWLNWFGKEELKKSYGEFIKSLFNPDNSFKYWGFKEIRYGIDDKVIDFLLTIFPKAKFVFIVREPIQVITSQVYYFNAGNKDKLVSLAIKWDKQNKLFYDFHQKNKSNCFIIRYEDLIDKNSTKLKELFDFLNFKLSEKQYRLLDNRLGRGATKKGELTDEEKEKIRFITKETAIRHGYEKSNEPVSKTQGFLKWFS